MPDPNAAASRVGSGSHPPLLYSGGVVTSMPANPSTPPGVMVSANGQYIIAQATPSLQSVSGMYGSSTADGVAMYHHAFENGGSSAMGTQNPNSTTATAGRHPLVQQYVDTKSSVDWNVKLIVGHIVLFCRDQDGSRFIQKQLDYGDNVALIFREVLPAASELMCDVFANYVVQKLFDTADEERRLILSQLIQGQVLHLATQTYGCRVLQKALDSVHPRFMGFVAEELRDHIPACVLDQNANHVVQKVIERMPTKVQFVADAFLGNMHTLCCHAYGCRVMQKLFEACYYADDRVAENPVAPTDLRPLYAAVLRHTDEFVVNQFGNYVVQHAIINSPTPLKLQFVSLLLPRIAELSKSKFGSNVAEKVIEVSNEEQRTEILNFLSETHGSGTEPPRIVHMMRDAFGNYVVQRLLDRSAAPLQQCIMERVVPHLVFIAETSFGKHLLGRLEKQGLISSSQLSTLGISVSTTSASTKHHEGGKGRAAGAGQGHSSRQGKGSVNKQQESRNATTEGPSVHGEAAGASHGGKKKGKATSVSVAPATVTSTSAVPEEKGRSSQARAHDPYRPSPTLTARPVDAAALPPVDLNQVAISQGFGAPFGTSSNNQHHHSPQSVPHWQSSSAPQPAQSSYGGTLSTATHHATQGYSWQPQNTAQPYHQSQSSAPQHSFQHQQQWQYHNHQASSGVSSNYNAQMTSTGAFRGGVPQPGGPVPDRDLTYQASAARAPHQHHGYYPGAH